MERSHIQETSRRRRLGRGCSARVGNIGDIDSRGCPGFPDIAARIRAGLSQAELARRMKTTQSTIARLESGRGKPSTRTLDRFAKATGHKLRISFEPVKRG